MADRALESLDVQSITVDDPQEACRRIVDAVVRILAQTLRCFARCYLAGATAGMCWRTIRPMP